MRPLRRGWIVCGVIAALSGAIAGCGAAATTATSTTASSAGTAAGLPATDSAAAGAGSAASDGSAITDTVTTPVTVTTLTATTATSYVDTTVTELVSGSTTTAATATTATTTTVELPGSGRPAILLGDMNTPEQFIIGALYQEALEAQGYTVQLNRNIGSTGTSEAAVSQGTLDIYPEYLDVYDSQAAGDSTRFKTLAEADRAGERYAERHGETLLAPTPFSDTTGIAVLTTYARAHHLHTIDDLRNLEASLTFGSPLEFSQQPSGLTALEQAYDFYPAVTTAVNIGEQYGQLLSDQIQATYVNTTDPELDDASYTLLRDDKHVFGFGNVVPVVSTKLLAEEGSVFLETIDRIDRLLTNRVIRGLAEEMESSADPAAAASEVAKDFLQGYGMVQSSPWSTVTTTTPLVATPTTTGTVDGG